MKTKKQKKIPRLAFIGAGNMASSIIAGLIADAYPADSIIATQPDKRALKKCQTKLGIEVIADNINAVRSADVVILCVKPQHISAVLQEIKAMISVTKPLLISIAAGIRVELLQRNVGKTLPIVRCMPNTPASERSAVTALFANAKVSNEQKAMASAIFTAVGKIVWISKESDLDLVTALSGSGPAYFFWIMEALEQSAIELGLSPTVARALTRQTCLGAARMAESPKVSVTALREQVTSPGGTTAAAIRVLEENNMRHILSKALAQALARAREIAEQAERTEVSHV